MQHYEDYEDIGGLIAHVRRRWRTLHACRAAVRAGLASTAVLAASIAAARWIPVGATALAAIGGLSVALVGAVLLWSLLPLRRLPDDRQVARFIEEREPALEDRLVSAVDVTRHAGGSAQAAGLAEPMLADAARRVRAIEIDRVLPADALRRAVWRAGAALLLLLAVMFTGRHAARQAYDAAALTLFPTHVALQVSPGNARIKAGSPLMVRAKLAGNLAPVVARLEVAEGGPTAEGGRVADGGRWRGADMTSERSGEFSYGIEAVTAAFKYRVVAGSVVSPVYDVVAVHPPRVARIDVDYTYPPGLGLPPRTERDSGDIYAPAGTDVRVHVVSDRPATTGGMSLGNGRTIPLEPQKPTELATAFRIVDDNSYRIVLADREGLSTAGDTEYFIRVLEDRPPDVRVLKPAADRAVTALEEVDIEGQADDDYGIDRLELVYSIRGGPERAIALQIPPRRTTVTGRHTLFLEDLAVQPGDFVSYFLRARDLTHGTRPNEARSDIFFLEVRPYEQEFSLAQSQSSNGPGAGRGSIDDLVAAQKDIIVATWKLDRRAQSAKGAKSEDDIRAVSRAEAELKSRVEQTSSTFRESTMRDPRKRPQRGRGGSPAPPELKAGDTLPEEDAMGAAAEAMGKAVVSLDGLKTGDARAPEMSALSYLIKAQAEVKKREVVRQQAGSGAGNNRSNYDLSTLFDKELQKQQQTNYETKSSAERKDDPNQSALDRVRDLARRQDELLKHQQELMRSGDKMTAEELRRELEKLTREQSELRQKAEELARQMAAQDRSSQSTQQQQPQQQPQPQQNPKAGQPGRQTSSGQPSESQNGSSGGGESGQQMHEVSEAMRSATNDLRRQDPRQATASGSRALDKLRDLERQLQSAAPDEQRRALGEMQLEARQLADAERQVASELGKTDRGEAGRDQVRRLAGEQQRLAERARSLEQMLKQQGGSRGTDPRGRAKASDAEAQSASTRAAAAEGAKELERERLADRMQQSADAMRAAADRAPAPQRGTASSPPPSGVPRAAAARGDPSGSDGAKGQAGEQQEMARAFDKLAERLSSALGATDGESRKLSDLMARSQQLREKIDDLTGQLKQLAQPNAAGQRQGGERGQSRGSSQTGSAATPGETGRTGRGQQGGGGGSGIDLARLRDDYQRALQETRDLLDQMRRDDPGSQTFARGGAGFTFEGQGMTLSAPGTETFKQDFARWEDLRRQATQALEAAETTISKKLQAKQAKDRLAAGAEDKAPAEYQKQVDEYFKAIAKKKGR